MKRGIGLIILCTATITSPLSYAREGDCVYSLSNGLTAYCSYISAPEGTKRFLEIIYNNKVAITSCADNGTLPFSFNKEMIGKNNLVQIGSYAVTFTQCNDIACDKKQIIGTSSFVIAPDKTVTPNKFEVKLDPAFGENCNPAEINPDNMAFIVSKTDCARAPYCINLSMTNKTSRIIKIVSDQQTATTYCLSNKQGVAIGPDVTAGQHTLNIYQCDNVACDTQVPLGNFVLNITPDKKFDHSKDTITTDDKIGKDCDIKSP